MKQKIKKIMASIFEINIEDIGDNASPENIAVWDSLKHMNLILALEEEFNIELNDEEIVSIFTLNDICNVFENK